MIKEYWIYVKRNWLSYPFVYLAKAFLRLVLFTCRIEVQGVEELKRVASQDRCILMLWHNRLTILPEILLKNAPQFIYCAFVSNSRDGELLAILANSYKHGRTLRVPHNARHQALSQMIKQLKQNHEVMIVTPDGPRGPRYQVKPGIVVAAQESSAYIIPFSWSANNFWQLKSWDQLRFPKPFTRIQATFGAPILIDNTMPIDTATDYLQDSLQSIGN